MNSKRPVRKAARSNSVHGFSGIAEGGAAPLSLPLLLSLCHCGACCPAVQHCPVENGCTAIWIGWCHLIGEVKRASAKDVVARQNPSDYSPRPSGGMPPILVPERGAAWLAHQSGGLGVVGSNPAAPTMQSSTYSCLASRHIGVEAYWKRGSLASPNDQARKRSDRARCHGIAAPGRHAAAHHPCPARLRPDAPAGAPA